MTEKEERFTKIVREQKGTVYTVCYMFSSRQDEVDDLFQDTLVNLWRGFDGFRGDSDVRTWVWRVALNTCISADRKKKRRPKTETLDFGVNLYEEPNDSDTRQVQLLHKRISRLPVFDRAIVLLWLEDLSYDEIASIVGITPSNVGVRLSRIKEEMRRMKDD